MKSYISGALMGSNNLEESKELYEYLGNISITMGIEPYIPHMNTDPILNSRKSAKDVYSLDMLNLMKSDLVVSYIGSPSLGVGAELAISIEKNKPIIGIYSKEDSVSRFVLGMLENDNNSKIIIYENLKELQTQLSSHFKAYLEEKKRQHLTLSMM